MNILTVTNTKGGTGKTTSTVSLAGALAEAGRGVLVVDLDPQGSATRWLHGPERDEEGRESPRQYGNLPMRVLTRDLALEEGIVSTDHEGIDLLPANATLEQAARALAAEPGGDAELGALLGGLDPDRYEFVLIDTPPTTGTLSSSALLAANALIIPVEARYMGLEGLAKILTTAERLALRFNRELPVAAVLICRLDRRNREGPERANQVRDFMASKHPGVPVHEVRENVRLSAAASSHQPITSFDPGATGAVDYRQVAVDLIERFGGARR